MSWRPWYHSLRALQLHQQVRKVGPVFRPYQPPSSFSLLPLVSLPKVERVNFTRYQDNPVQHPHYQYEDLVLTQLSNDHYLLSDSNGQVSDVLPREIVKNDVASWFLQ